METSSPIQETSCLHQSDYVSTLLDIECSVSAHIGYSNNEYDDWIPFDKNAFQHSISYPYKQVQSIQK
ncbi:hypothetical protein ENUP19_0346G0019 [Entamoeba nuttalli]|uniref:Uncharacterized protein n=1 Tax=Entamoeba nuttalli TaxID=412467 RepID=A0ABQ0DWN1_9EUKA